MLAATPATGWRAWLVGAVVFAASIALVVLAGLVLLGIGPIIDLQP